MVVVILKGSSQCYTHTHTLYKLTVRGNVSLKHSVYQGERKERWEWGTPLGFFAGCPIAMSGPLAKVVSWVPAAPWPRRAAWVWGRMGRPEPWDQHCTLQAAVEALLGRQQGGKSCFLVEPLFYRISVKKDLISKVHISGLQPLRPVDTLRRETWLESGVKVWDRSSNLARVDAQKRSWKERQALNRAKGSSGFLTKDKSKGQHYI